uniref:Uncharacterized protein n=1 Tax=Bradyrhizobium quebecense TaxID=2748629 RepID=A0ABS3MCR7_9BRAD
MNEYSGGDFAHRQFRFLSPRYGRRPKHQEQRKHRTAMSHVSASVFPGRAIDVVALQFALQQATRHRRDHYPCCTSSCAGQLVDGGNPSDQEETAQ